MERSCNTTSVQCSCTSMFTCTFIKLPSDCFSNEFRSRASHLGHDAEQVTFVLYIPWLKLAAYIICRVVCCRDRFCLAMKKTEINIINFVNRISELEEQDVRMVLAFMYHQGRNENSQTIAVSKSKSENHIFRAIIRIFYDSHYPALPKFIW